MLGARDNGLGGVAIHHLEYPGTAPLPDDGSGLSMEPPVGHALVNTGLNDNMNFLTDFKPLDKPGDGREPPPPQVLLQQVSGLLSWTIVVCHMVSPDLSRSSDRAGWISPAGIFDMDDIDPDHAGGHPQCAGEAGVSAAFVTGNQFFDIEACFADDVN